MSFTAYDRLRGCAADVDYTLRRLKSKCASADSFARHSARLRAVRDELTDAIWSTRNGLGWSDYHEVTRKAHRLINEVIPE